MDWESAGHIVGPTGPQGEKGDKGEKGDQGPQGPQEMVRPKGDKGGVEAYGERYLHTNQTLSIKQYTDTVILLPNTNPSFP